MYTNVSCVSVICTAIWEFESPYMKKLIKDEYINTYSWVDFFAYRILVTLQDVLKLQTQSRNADDDDNDFSVSDLIFSACSRNNQEAVYLMKQLLF